MDREGGVNPYYVSPLQINHFQSPFLEFILMKAYVCANNEKNEVSIMDLFYSKA